MVDKKDLQRFTVVHICAAHSLKAVSHAVSNITKDKGLHDFAIFCFALLQNSTNLKKAKAMFLQMCVVFLGMKNTPAVKTGIVELSKYIHRDTWDAEGEMSLKAHIPEEDDFQGTVHTITGRSPFTQEFRSIHQKALDILSNEDHLMKT